MLYCILLFKLKGVARWGLLSRALDTILTFINGRLFVISQNRRILPHHKCILSCGIPCRSLFFLINNGGVQNDKKGRNYNGE